MATININGKVYSGNNVRIIDGCVTIDGVSQGDANGIVEIRITEGVINSLTTDGSVNCGEVHGNIKAGGSVNCDDVGGSINCGGSVNCDAIGGSVIAGGSVRHG